MSGIVKSGVSAQIGKGIPPRFDGVPISLYDHADARRLEFYWKQVAGGVRVAVRQYDRSRSGPEYVSKCLGANSYEVSKYAFANSVTLSASVVRLITHLDALGDRRCRADMRKNGQVLKNVGAINGSSFPEVSKLCDETASQIVGKNEN